MANDWSAQRLYPPQGSSSGDSHKPMQQELRAVGRLQRTQDTRRPRSARRDTSGHARLAICLRPPVRRKQAVARTQLPSPDAQPLAPSHRSTGSKLSSTYFRHRQFRQKSYLPLRLLRPGPSASDPPVHIARTPVRLLANRPQLLPPIAVGMSLPFALPFDCLEDAGPPSIKGTLVQGRSIATVQSTQLTRGSVDHIRPDDSCNVSGAPTAFKHWP